MKRSLPKLHQNKAHLIKDLIQFELHVLDVYIRNEDIDIEYYDSWNFYKVSLYKWTQADFGCGTLEWRNNKWNETVDVFRNRFQTFNELQSWRWFSPSSRFYSGWTKSDVECIPGITFFIKTES